MQMVKRAYISYCYVCVVMKQKDCRLGIRGKKMRVVFFKLLSQNE